MAANPTLSRHHVAFILLWVILGHFQVSIKGQSCPNGTGFHTAETDEKCYFMVEHDTLPWLAANTDCMDIAELYGFSGSQASLVSIESPTEQNLVYDLVYEAIVGMNGFTEYYTDWPYRSTWIGLSKPSFDFWHWIKDCEECPHSMAGYVGKQGCFDNAGGITTSVSVSTTTLSPESCKAGSIAQDVGAFMALLNGDLCYTGDGSWISSMQTLSCTTVCPGDNTENCGGPSAYNVYNLTGLFAWWENDQPNYVGGNQLCGALFANSNPDWSNFELADAECYAPAYYACELMPSDCPSTNGGGYYNVASRCLYVETTSMETWFGARWACAEMGGGLAIIDSWEVASFLKAQLTFAANENVWVGMVSSAWDWNSDVPAWFYNWEGDSPKNVDYSCAGINSDTSLPTSLGYWNSQDCSEAHLYACQIVKSGPTTVADTTTEAIMSSPETSVSDDVMSTAEVPKTSGGNNDVTSGSTVAGAGTSSDAPNATTTTTTTTTTTMSMTDADTTTASPVNTPSAGASTGGSSSSLSTFEIVLIVVIIVLVILIILAVILLVYFKKTKGKGRVGGVYDARPAASVANSDEIYIPPSETGSTYGLLADPNSFLNAPSARGTSGRTNVYSRSADWYENRFEVSKRIDMND